MNQEQKLEFGIEIVAAMKATCYNWDIEEGRIDALMETEIDRLEGVSVEEFNTWDESLKLRVIDSCKREKERLHKQAMFVAEIAIAKYKNIVHKLTKGQLVFFEDELLPYRVMAISDRYAVVSRKLNKKQDKDLIEFEVERSAYHSKKAAYEAHKDSPVYAIVDFKENQRASDNLIFGITDYFDSADCEKCIKMLQDGEVGLSKRTGVELAIDWERTLSNKKGNQKR